MLFLFLLFVFVVAGAIYAMVFSARRENVTSWIKESFEASKESKLDVSNYDVQMQDSNIGEVFNTFGTEAPAYYTPEDVEEQLDRMMTTSSEQVAQIASRFRKSDEPDEDVAVSDDDSAMVHGNPQVAYGDLRDAYTEPEAKTA